MGRKFLWIVMGLAMVMGLGAAGIAGGVASVSKGEPSDINIELTVYNQQLALVKDQRMFELPTGLSMVVFSDVAAALDPTSVVFKTPGLAGVQLLEQNYEYDIVNDAKLLQKYLGAKITVTDVQGKLVEGYLLSAGENIILSTAAEGGEIRMLKADQIKSIAFPQLPGGLVLKPTLVWLLQNANPSGKQLVELSYLTSGLSWQADYVATINEADNRIDLSGWVTLNNQSGAEYKNARLKLVAGDVQRAPEEDRMVTAKVLRSEAFMGQGFAEQSFFEYHLYTLGRPTTIKNNQMKQVELLTAEGIPVQKRFVYEGALTPNKVKVMLEFTNSDAHHLGIPLPKGKIRVQKGDHEGALQFIGEDRIDHTSKDEKVRLYVGNAFDIVAERLRTQVKEPSKNWREETYQIRLSNHKTEAATVTVVENISGWREASIVNASHSYTRSEADRIEFVVELPAGEERTVNYTVRYKI